MITTNQTEAIVKCPLYQRDIAGADAARLFATLLVTEERQAVKMAG
jgi:hypothetical protein